MNIVVFYVSTMDPLRGGVERASQGLRRILERQGHEVFLVSWKKVSDEGGCIHLPVQGQLKSPQNIGFFRDFVRCHKVSVVIDQSAYCVGCEVFCNCVRSEGVKLVGVFHCTLFGYFGQKCKPFRWLPIFLARFKYREHCKALATDYDRFVVLSEKYKEEVRFFCGRQAFRRTSSIPNMLTLSPEADCDGKQNVVLFVGRMASQKRPDKMLRVWKRVYEGHRDWRLVMLGDGPMLAEMKEMARRLHLENCSFLGFCNPESHYRKAKILCMTSSHEGFGLVLLEAMCHGCVPMAFNSYANASELIADGKDGLLVPPFDIKGYAERLAALMDDDVARKRMQSNRMEKLAMYSPNAISDKWSNLLCSL